MRYSRYKPGFKELVRGTLGWLHAAQIHGPVSPRRARVCDPAPLREGSDSEKKYLLQPEAGAGRQIEVSGRESFRYSAGAWRGDALNYSLFITRTDDYVPA